MKQLLKSLCLLMLLCGRSQAQEIARGEYFIDTDPGIGLATPLTAFAQNDTVNISQSIALTGYNAGFHNLYIRFQADNGTWSVIDARSFYIYVVAPASSNADSIVAVETY